MRGRVGENASEAFLVVSLFDEAGNRAEIEFAVDTGFTGALSLPPRIVESMRLPLAGRGFAVLADGSGVETWVYLVRIFWHGRMRAVRVLATEGGPLAGMALLRGSKLTIHVSPGGEVVVEEESLFGQ